MENKLPEGWEWKKLGEIAVVEKKVVLPEEIKGTYQKYIGLENIEKDTGRLTNFSETLGDEIKSNKYRFTVENILYGKLRPYLNKVFLPDFEGICSTDILTIKTIKGKAIREYVALLMRQPFFVSYASTRSSGANLPRINESKLLECKIPLPPLETQKKIVSILEKVEETKKLRAQADELTQKLLQSVFLEMFGDPVKNPKNWEKKTLKEFGELITGNTPSREKPEYYGNYIEWIKSDNINTPYTYLTRSEEMLSEKGAKVGRIAPINSVLVTCIAGSLSCIGNVAIADRNVAFNQQINAIVPNENVNTSFLYHLILNTKEYIQSHSTQSMKGMVSKGAFGSISFIMPPIESQMKFAEFSKRVEKMIMSQKQSSLEINNLFDALMQKAFMGELVL